MPSFYPPVLESKAKAIPYVSKEQASGYYFEIEFSMPTINVLNDIGHIQVSIKNQATNEAAVNPENSPDRAVLYIKRNEGTPFFLRKDNGNYLIKIPYYCFAGETPQKGTTYCVQVRFGVDQTLWDPATNGINGLGAVGAFAAWRQTQVNAVPSGFGEWSNVMTVYCYGPATETLEYNLNDFVPEVVYSYVPENGVNDPLEQVKIVYQYADLYGSAFGTEVFNGVYQQDGSYSVKAKLPLAPVQQINISVEAVTKNNTVRGKTLTILPLKNTQELDVLDGEMKEAYLQSEETEDGVIAKTVIIPNSSKIKPQSTMSVYRCELYSLKAVKIIDNLTFTTGSEITFKDFTVEMGEEYQYVVGVKDFDGKCYATVIDVYDWGYENPGYARLMRMDSVFLTTKNHQLRLQGGVNITSYKRNTQDTFQTTLGSKYPFYSRNSQMNYRTCQLTGLVTILFDPTGTFLRNDEENGLWWDDDNGSKLVILNKDIYGEYQISLSRRRMKSDNSGEIVEILGNEDYKLERVQELGELYENWHPREVFGPKSIYDPYYYRNINRVATTDINDQMIYLERKFRDCVMEWLSDGKPKLFRSETEGNMIVMLSGISFTPQAGSGRMTYTVTATLTEIAEANLENLITYNLVPIEIVSKIISNFPKEIKTGDIISNEDYLTLIGKDPNLKALFEKAGNEWRFIAADEDSLKLINDILRSFTDYTFIRGDEDPYVFDGLIYQYNPIFNIPNSISGQPIKSIDTKPAIYNGSGNYRFAIIDGLLPDDLEFKDGVISGTPIWEDYDRARPKDTLTLEVTDLDSGETATMEIKVGYIYSALQFNLLREDSQPIITVPISTIGEPITPISLAPYVKGGLKFSDMEDLDTDADYMWSAQGLPAGLSIDQKGMISGSYLSEVRGGVALITVIDGMGQSVIQELHYGDGVKQISFQDSSDYDMYYTEVNVPIDPIDVSGGVSGGYPAAGSSDYPKGYEFSATSLPPGITIDSHTGIISGTPTRTLNAGSAVITATDFGNPRNSASIKIIYQEVLPEFKFEYNPRLDIDPHGNGTSMPLGLVLEPPIEVQKEGEECVTGGLKFADPPYYRFTSEKLIPDFTIDNYGKITGRASVASPKRTATLIARDARGKECSVEINVVEILAKLQFNPSHNYSLPTTWVGNNDPSYQIVIPMTDLSHGVPPYKVELANDWPRGIGLTIRTNDDSSKDIIISGVPTDSFTSGMSTIIFTDSSPEKETIHYKIPVGQVVGTLTWTQDIDDISNWTTVDGEVTSALEVGVLSTFYLKDVVGGLQPYTLKCLEPDEMGPMKIYQTEGGEQEATKIYIQGIPTEDWPGENGRVLTFILTDALGQEVQKVMTLGKGQAALTLRLLNNLGSSRLVANKTHITSMPIMEITGGSATGTNRYYYQDDNQDTIIPDLKLDHNNGTISGTITQTNGVTTDISRDFYGRQDNRRVYSNDRWQIPPIVDQPSRGINIGSTYVVSNLVLGQEIPTVQLIKNNSYLGQQWRIEGDMPQGFFFQEGLFGGTPTASFDARTVRCILEVPRYEVNQYCYIEEMSIFVDISFEGAYGLLSWSPVVTQISGLEVNTPMSDFEISTGLSGGQSPLTWIISAEAPGWLKIKTEDNGRKAYLWGTPTEKITVGVNFSVTVKDSRGDSITKSFRISPFYDPLVFTDDPRMDIPPLDAGKDMTPFDIMATGLVSGGTGSYEFRGINLSPYSVSATGVISGNSGNNSQLAKTGQIIVRDTNTGIEKTVEVSVGAIKGEMTYTHDTSRDIPPGRVNTSGTINFKPGVLGGNTPQFEISEYPKGDNTAPSPWTQDLLKLDKNTGILTYRRPATATKATSFLLRVYDANGNGDSTNIIQIGEVTA